MVAPVNGKAMPMAENIREFLSKRMRELKNQIVAQQAEISEKFRELREVE
jgi:hypothetical protein